MNHWEMYFNRIKIANEVGVVRGGSDKPERDTTVEFRQELANMDFCTFFEACEVVYHIQSAHEADTPDYLKYYLRPFPEDDIFGVVSFP